MLTQLRTTATEREHGAAEGEQEAGGRLRHAAATATDGGSRAAHRTRRHNMRKRSSAAIPYRK